ncbi:MAG: hypothetical protein E2O44_01290 [Nitrospina sp.]|nr:MAG: hypothetical protein E2O44_01290 [Nitrospina sp.]
MIDTFAKELDCVLCQSRYFPVFEPAEEKPNYKIYCSSCVRWVYIGKGDPVRAALREVLGIKQEALALAIQTYLNVCPCGQEFSHDSGKRCPDCIEKIKKETKAPLPPPADFHCLWDIKKLKELEGKIFEYISNRLATEGETLNQLIARFEAGEIDPGTYMTGVEDLQFRESTDICVLKTWAMLVGPEMVFRAAEEHGLVERYGSRVLISIASGLEMGYGTSILTTLSREEKNLDGSLQKEIQTFLKKIAGGF